MIEFEECAKLLDDIADSMPFELYRELNCGISLLPRQKIHPMALHNDLFIMAEYIRNSLGNAIVFYYGSIARIYGNVSREQLEKELSRILRHELRHHNEHLAGCDDLGIMDDEQILEYLKRNGVKPK